jgi:hypothetical protein
LPSASMARAHAIDPLSQSCLEFVVVFFMVVCFQLFCLSVLSNSVLVNS